MDEIIDTDHLRRELSNTMSRIEADIHRAVFLIGKCEFEGIRLDNTCQEFKRDFLELEDFLVHQSLTGDGK